MAALRCIYCARSERKVTLNDKFSCEDRTDCEDYMAEKNAPPKTVCLYFDAACLGANKAGGQPLGLAVYTTINGEHSEEWSGIKAMEWGTNNDGEWTAFLYALGVARLMKKTGKRYVFKVFGDSKLVVDTFNGLNKVSSKFRKYHDKATRFRHSLGTDLVAVVHILREYNQEADKLSKEALLLHER